MNTPPPCIKERIVRRCPEKILPCKMVFVIAFWYFDTHNLLIGAVYLQIDLPRPKKQKQKLLQIIMRIMKKKLHLTMKIWMNC